MPSMGDMFRTMKQMQKIRKVQKELEKKTYEARSQHGEVTVVARGDMSVKSIVIAPDAMEKNNLPRMEKLLVSTVNSALDSCKKAAASDMSKLTEGLGLGNMGGLLGG